MNGKERETLDRLYTAHLNGYTDGSLSGELDELFALRPATDEARTRLLTIAAQVLA